MAMADSLAGVVLAAGAGTRLRPLSLLRPKALCPLGDRPLLDHALEAVSEVAADLAVNVHHGRTMIEGHLERWVDRHGAGVHVSVEREVALGTAGALGHLGRWLDGRDVLVVNADTWQLADLGRFVASWDGERVAVLTPTGGAFGPGSSVAASLLPGAVAAVLPDEPCGLWEVLWGPESAAGRLQAVHTEELVMDCGTPARYLAANLVWSKRFSDGRSVVGEGAEVEGTLERCVVWPRSHVARGEHLVAAIRAEHLTVLVR
jgi:NDP-sugar pyrophosphorylase family protein